MSRYPIPVQMWFLNHTSRQLYQLLAAVVWCCWVCSLPQVGCLAGQYSRCMAGDGHHLDWGSDQQIPPRDRIELAVTRTERQESVCTLNSFDYVPVQITARNPRWNSFPQQRYQSTVCMSWTRLRRLRHSERGLRYPQQQPTWFISSHNQETTKSHDNLQIKS